MKPKKSSGIDFVSPDILKRSMDIISVPLQDVIDASIIKGEFPDNWKCAKVSPLLIRGNPLAKQNYRAISNLKAASKVLEVVVQKQLVNHFEANQLFTD